MILSLGQLEIVTLCICNIIMTSNYLSFTTFSGYSRVAVMWCDDVLYDLLARRLGPRCLDVP